MVKIAILKLSDLVEGNQEKSSLSVFEKDILFTLKKFVEETKSTINYNIISIRSHDTKDKCSVDYINELIKPYRDNINNIILLSAYASFDDYPAIEYKLPGRHEEDGDKNKKVLPLDEILQTQKDLYEALGFMDMNFWQTYEYSIPFIYMNPAGVKIYNCIKLFIDEFEKRKKYQTDESEMTLEDKIRSSYISGVDELSACTGILANEPEVYKLVTLISNKVKDNTSSLPVPVLNSIYAFINSLLYFLKAWDEFDENTKILDGKTTAQILDIESNLITAGHKLIEAYKATCIRLSTDDYELLENFRNKLQTYVVEHVAK